MAFATMGRLLAALVSCILWQCEAMARTTPAAKVTDVGECGHSLSATKLMLEGSPAHIAVPLAGSDAAVAFTVGWDQAVMGDDDALNAPRRSSALLYLRQRGKWFGSTISAPGLIVAVFQDTKRNTVFWSEVTAEGSSSDFQAILIAGKTQSQPICASLAAPPPPPGRSILNTKFDIVEYGRVGRRAQVIGQFAGSDEARLSPHRYLYRSSDGGKSWGAPRRINDAMHVAYGYQTIEHTNKRLERSLMSSLDALPEPE